jgi:P4 family phage/plasmid primase-like protien
MVQPFQVWAGSHPEIAMRVNVDIERGPDFDSDARFKSFWAIPRSGMLMMSMGDLKELSARALTVFSDGAMWRYDQYKGIWEMVHKSDVMRCILHYDSFELGGQTKRKGNIYLTSGIANSIREILYSSIEHQDFFKGVRRNGFPMATGYWSVKGGRLIQEKHDPWNLLRFQYPSDWFDRSLEVIEQGVDVATWDPLGLEWNDHCPVWMWFLRKVTAAKPVYGQCIQEWTAASVTGQITQLQKFLLIVGEGGNGKGTLMKVLSSLFPAGTVVSTNPGKWKEDYHCTPLIGKLLNVCFETSALANTDIIKSVVTGDEIEARRTGANSSEKFNYTPIAGHIFSANALPDVKLDQAILDRVIVLTFDQKFRGTDQQLKEASIIRAIKAELPGVLFWLAAGLLRLAKTGRIAIPPDSVQVSRRWAVDADEVQSFVAECCKADPQAFVKGDSLYTAFRLWCSKGGIPEHKVQTRRVFSSRLAKMGYQADLRGPANDRFRAYVGISFVSM